MHPSLGSSFSNVVVILPTVWEADAILMMALNRPMDASPDKRFHKKPYLVWSQKWQRTRISLIVSGIGPLNAAGAVGWAVAKYQPEAILMTGSAGAVHPNLLRGDIVIGSSYRSLFYRDSLINRRRYLYKGEPMQTAEIDADPMLLNYTTAASMSALPCMPAWPKTSRTPKLITGCIGSMDHRITEPEELQRFHSEGVVAQDMGSAAAAMVAASHGVPFIAIRGIFSNGLRGLQQPGSVKENVASSTASHNAGAVIALVLRYIDEGRC